MYILKNKSFILCLFLLPFYSTLSLAVNSAVLKVVDESLSFSEKQYFLMADRMNDKTGLLPRTLDQSGNLLTSDDVWWTSGFFPGTLWYLYEFNRDEKMKSDAVLFSDRIL